MDLENYLHLQIPITSALGVKVETVSLEKIILSAPFSNNINHKKTVFGGSLHAVATLACWSLLHVNLTKLFADEPIQIVIARSEVDYIAPVTADFQAECHLPDPKAWEHFLTAFQKKGKGRLQLQATIYENNRLCVGYSGIFVAIR